MINSVDIFCVYHLITRRLDWENSDENTMDCIRLMFADNGKSGDGGQGTACLLWSGFMRIVTI
jgi:hypothetical protein